MSTISREELISLIDHRITHAKDARKRHTSVFVDGMKDGYARIRSDVLLMPSAEPERKKGRWIYEGKRGRFPACRCSECGNVENADWAILGDNVNYCPNCGAYMIEVKEAEK